MNKNQTNLCMNFLDLTIGLAGISEEIVLFFFAFKEGY